MKAISFIKKNAMLLLAGAAIISFSSFKMMEKSSQSSVTLYFTGNTSSATDVEDASLWIESSTPPTCSGSQKACSMTVNPNDVIGSAGSRELNPARITLDAISTSSGFVPQKNLTESHKDSDKISVQNKN